MKTCELKSIERQPLKKKKYLLRDKMLWIKSVGDKICNLSIKYTDTKTLIYMNVPVLPEDWSKGGTRQREVGMWCGACDIRVVSTHTHFLVCQGGPSITPFKFPMVIWKERDFLYIFFIAMHQNHFVSKMISRKHKEYTINEYSITIYIFSLTL